MYNNWYVLMWHATDKTEGKRVQEKKKERKEKKTNPCLHFHSHLHTCKLTEHLKYVDYNIMSTRDITI